MSKQLVKIGLMMSVIALVFGSVGVASAASPSPQVPGGNGRGGNGGGIGTGTGTYDPLNLNLSDDLDESMHATLADAVGLTVEQLEARLDAGESYTQIAMDYGFTLDEAQDMVQQARTDALTQAVADGLITQEQADFLSSRGNRGAGVDGSIGMGTGMGAAGGMSNGRRGGK